MSEETTPPKPIELKLVSPVPINRKLYVYILRQTTPDEKFKIKLYLNNDIKYTFERGRVFDDKSNNSPYVYCAQLDLIVDHQDRLFVQQPDGLLLIENYRLYLSRKVPQLDTTFRDYKDEKCRTFDSPRSTTHYFLFDVNFAKNLVDGPPGNNVPFWSQFCLFTFYLLRRQMHAVFDTLINQFEKIVEDDRRVLTTVELNDFFHSCLTYSPYSQLSSENQYIAYKILIRLMGIPPITRTNLDLRNAANTKFTIALVDSFKDHYDDVLATISESDWPLFCAGLTAYLSIDLLIRSRDTIMLIRQMSDKQCQRELANNLLCKLGEFHRPIVGQDWTDLFELVDPNILTLAQLELTASIQIYITSLVKFVEIHRDDMDICEQIIYHFDRLIFENRLTVDLHSIVFLVKFLQMASTEEVESMKNILLAVNQPIEMSIQLREKIRQYLSNFTMTIEHFQNIRFIVDFLSHSIILHLINHRDLLINLLDNAKASYSYEFFKQWVCSFLLFNIDFNDRNRVIYQDLLKHWSNKLEKHYEWTIQILTDIDGLVKAFEHEQYRMIFIQHMIDLCFRQKSIYRVISDALIYLQNDLFLEQFKKKFALTYLKISSEKLKQLANLDNPLAHLIKLAKQTKDRPRLIDDLIQLAAEKIQFTTNEILRDAFEQPLGSCVHAILFEQAFENCTARQMIIDQLLALWSSWEEKGFRADQILNWKNFSMEERQIVQRIWNYVGQTAEKQYQIDLLIDKQRREMDEKIQIRERISRCLEIYCKHAVDKQLYLNLLAELEKQLRSEIVRSIQIPDEVQLLLPYTDRLNPIEKLHPWQRFLREKRDLNLKNSPTTATTSSLVDSLLYDDSVPRPTTAVGFDLNENTSFDQRSCLDILNEDIAILDMFIDDLQKMCTEWKYLPISSLLHLFPNIQYVDHDFEILQSLIKSEATQHLKLILEYWKNRDYMNHICRGYINLIDNLGHPRDNLCKLMKKIPQMNEHTKGLQCDINYRDFSSQFLERHSHELLHFISQYSRSDELIKFVNVLPSSDVDNLLQAANDWDETLINTKTILDFVLLKRFFVRFNDQVDARTRDSPTVFTFDQVETAFEKTFEDELFRDLFNCFQTCSASLPSIKRVHLELTDKKSFKRKRIADLMQNIEFGFIEQANRFDIQIQSQSIGFNDLSELRDRARLIEYSINNNKFLIDADRDVKELGSFVNFVETVEKILENFSLLNVAGHPMIIECLLPKKSFTCIKSNCEELTEFSSRLKILLDDWEIYLCRMYERHVDLTYFSYQQIWIVEDYLYNPIEPLQTNHSGYHLLKYIGIQPETIRVEDLPMKSSDPNERLENLGRIFSAQRKQTPLLPKEENRHVKKIYLVQPSDEGILRAILSLFQHFSQTVAVNHLFYCTEQTSWMEIRAFTYRCFHSQDFHQLIRPELLSASIQNHFTHLLRQLIDQDPQHYFRLGIISTVSKTQLQLIDGLRTLQIVQTVHDSDLLNPADLKSLIQKLIDQNSMFVTSAINGLGKSYFIQNEIKKQKKIPIKFPICGDFHVDTIAERLCAYGEQLASSKAALHIDIGAINNIKQLNEVLYCLLLFRSFRLGRVAVYVPVDVPIYIEFDSSPHLITLHNKIILLKFLKVEHIESIDWNKFDLSNSSTTVSFVVNYLQAIKDETILKRNITEDNLTKYDRTVSINLLKDIFLLGKDPDFVTWTQLSIFLSVYYHLFSGFSRCGFFLIETVANPKLRLDLLQSLLQSSKQFTSLCVESVRKNQRSVQNNDAMVTISESIVRWDRTQPFTVVFSTDGNPIFVYKNPKDVPKTLDEAFRIHLSIATRKKSQELNEPFPDYSHFTHTELFLRLASLSKKYFIKSICPKCYRQYEHEQEYCTKCESKIHLFQPVSTQLKDIEQFQMLIAKRLQGEYILTPDNYIKMLLIYLRVQSGLPVLIMGETGCGKTALIQFLCQKILDDEMEIFRIHAGVTSEQIIEMMTEYFGKADLCQFENKRLWVFLDEFNTTSNIGLLKEITCERTLLGKPLPNNMVLLGACNPQRRKQETRTTENRIGIKKDLYEMQRLKDSSGISLLYTVVPIPETMLEYVWDYGYLDDTIETEYIRTMLNTCEQLGTDTVWFDKIVILISKSQKFLRDLEDVSSVSLRDVARFCRLYNWFRRSILEREGVQRFINNICILLQRSSLVALLLCYYFRLNSPMNRKNYISLIEENLQSVFAALPPNRNILLEILDLEQRRLIQRMELPTGTAKNRALMDNIFVLLVCIINRIPVVICGKPGCSKTSAVQIVISNLKGRKSSDVYFQTLPELITVSYQGSQNCTSESIIKVFQRADKYLNAKSDANILPVIVFDEIGLAELSPHNPLKVLHSNLEVETCQYGFVGLSNWRLDASKMNRALYLSCPDPDVQDLQLTAKTISDSIVSSENQIARTDPRIIEALATSYYHLYEYLQSQQEQQIYSSYFGLRDFYSLIKGVVNDLIQTQNEHDAYACIRRQLIINFDGILDGSQLMWKYFCEYIQNTNLIERYPCPTFKQLLDQRLTSRRGRYLMLIAENESLIDYVEQYIIAKHQPPPVRTLIGSCFADDLISGTTYTEQYNYRVLMDIILYAETNVTLIMRRMGHLYDNLYDLFNQNFTRSGKKNYCRIALGALYHPRCLVNEDFYCVVFVRKEDLDKCDPPFLNRFEKHVIDMKSLVHRNVLAITDQFLTGLLELLPTHINRYFPLLQHLFVDYSNDYLCNLVIDAFDRLNIAVDDDSQTTELIDDCMKKLIRTSSFDFPLILSLQAEKYQSLIDCYYDIHTNLSFEFVISQALDTETLPNQIIYTYTQIYHVITYQSTEIEEIKLNAFETELGLTNKVKEHYQRDDSRRLLIIRVDYHHEHEHILLLKHILLNCKPSRTNRSVWLILHLQRNMLNQTVNEVVFNDWFTLMIDDLNQHRLIPKEILFDPSYYSLVTHSDYLLSECILDELTDRCLMKFRYTVSPKDSVRQINLRRNQIIECFASTEESSSLRTIVQEHLLDLIRNIGLNRFVDWRDDLLTNGMLIGTCRSIKDAIVSTISLYYETYLLLLFRHFETYSFFDSFFFLQQNHHLPALKAIWSACLTSTFATIDTTIINVDMIEMPLVFDLYLPCARAEYENIRSVRQIILQRREDDINEEDLIHLAMKQLRSKSVYGVNIDMIWEDQDLFRYYYSDQLSLAQSEANIYQLSSLFIQRLLLSNPIQSVMHRLKHLLVDYNELFDILRLFEIGGKIIDEESFTSVLFDDQFIDVSTDSNEGLINNVSLFYKLVLTSEHYCLIPPRSEISTDEHIFQCDGDPFIEVCIMNLIEYLVAPATINRVDNIEQLTTTYSLIAQGIAGLKHYSVNNLEKLRSFLSLIRSITTLIPSKTALNVFKQACDSGHFDGSFQTCDDIHMFINYLQRIITAHQPNGHEAVTQRTLLKLESEFLKNWLVDHSEEYLDIITLMNQSDNYLWQYSAKIFTYIERKLQLLAMINTYQGQIPWTSSDEETRHLTLQYQQFNEHVQQLDDSSRKIEQIMVTRLHMHLTLSVNNKQIIENILREHYIQFEENIRQIQNSTDVRGLTFIFLISWVKYYAQLYAFILINDGVHPILDEIDRFLTRDDFLFCSTIKLFLVKQLCQMSSVTLNDLREIMINRDVTWIRPMIALPSGQKTREARRALILPTPLFECSEEFVRVDRILTHSDRIDELRQLVGQCQANRCTFYSFLMWFIHYYARFSINDETTSNHKHYLDLVETHLSKEIIECFELIGYKLLVYLCTNFNHSTYFQLHSNMKSEELHQRLVALNLVAYLLSLKTLPHTTHLGSLLFDGNLKMPRNYTEHLQSSVCLPGLISSDPVITQMIDVRTTVKERLDQGQIHAAGKFVYRCSEDCLWMYYFVNCGVPVDRSRCPLCQKEIGAAQYGVMIERQPPQIQMTIDEGFRFITTYIDECNKKARHGYHNLTPAIQSNEYEKSDHLNRPISYRFMHLITHATLLFLDELALLPDFNLPNRSHFREHFEKDYSLLCQQSTDANQSYIWLYKVINHMLSKDFLLKGFMNSNEKVVLLEKCLEEKLIFNHVESITNEINQYQIAYAEYIRQQNEEVTIDDFVEEIYYDDDKYPFLQFFNVTNIYTSDPIAEFRIRLRIIPHGEQIYPVTSFLMKRLGDYANIQYLYPIVTFTNYLIDKFNHRIKRNNAAETSIAYYLTPGPDYEIVSELYNKFLHAWYELNLNEVRYGCQTVKFELPSSKEDFAVNTKIAMVLLNTSKDDSSILLAACLRTIGELQNEIVHFFHKKIANDDEQNRYRDNAIPIQSIRSEQLLQLDGKVISRKLVTDGLTINYKYGKSKDIIYDYEEIELTLRNMISCLPLIDTEKFRFLNYQFELYSENTALINDVRKRIRQESLKANERLKLKNLINGMQNDDVLHYLGSLDYVFTYLRNIDDEPTNESITIQSFVEKYIRSKACLNDKVLQQAPFATIPLKYIIDLYELLEESAFDQVLRHYMKQNLTEESFLIEQRETFVRQFGEMTFKKETISPVLVNIHSWIGILKRLMVRVLSNVNVSVDVPIQLYLERTDLWTGNVTDADIQTFLVNDGILLQHTYIILKGLENERDNLSSTIRQPMQLNEHPLQNTDTQLSRARTWHHDNMANSSLTTRVIRTDAKPGKKMRV